MEGDIKLVKITAEVEQKILESEKLDTERKNDKNDKNSKNG